jgi:hypothetical protein
VTIKWRTHSRSDDKTVIFPQNASQQPVPGHLGTDQLFQSDRRGSARPAQNRRAGRLDVQRDSHARWLSDPACRFLDQALRHSDASRTALQRRALVAIQLLSNSWLSLQPDVCLLTAVMALEVLLGEDTGAKKYLIAPRVSYLPADIRVRCTQTEPGQPAPSCHCRSGPAVPPTRSLRGSSAR